MEIPLKDRSGSSGHAGRKCWFKIARDIHPRSHSQGRALRGRLDTFEIDVAIPEIQCFDKVDGYSSRSLSLRKNSLRACYTSDSAPDCAKM